MLLLRGFVVDVGDQGGIEQGFGLDPKIVAGFALALRVGDQTGDELQNVLFGVNVRERIIVMALFEVDRVHDLDAIPVATQQVPALDHDAALRVLSIRIEKKVNYFYEVTTSD